MLTGFGTAVKTPLTTGLRLLKQPWGINMSRKITKILVTGAGGFLASRLIEMYRERYQVTGLTHRQLDILKPEAIREIMEQLRPDIVLHCAAISDVARCGREPELSWAINVEGSANVAAACARYSARIVLCSSDQVYFGAPGTDPHREDEILNPPHEYGKQKLEAERECMRNQKDSVILRLSWLFDSHVSDAEHGTLVTDILRKASNGEKLSYPVHDIRSITYVHEATAHMEKVWNLPPGIYNYGSENNKNTYEIAKLVLSLCGITSAQIVPNEEAFRDHSRNLAMDISKIKKLGIHFNNTEQSLRLALDGHG